MVAFPNSSKDGTSDDWLRDQVAVSRLFFSAEPWDKVDPGRPLKQFMDCIPSLKSGFCAFLFDFSSRINLTEYPRSFQPPPRWYCRPPSTLRPWMCGLFRLSAAVSKWIFWSWKYQNQNRSGAEAITSETHSFSCRSTVNWNGFLFRSCSLIPKCLGYMSTQAFSPWNNIRS